MGKRLHICRCGRLHFIEENSIPRLSSDGKVLLFICSRCGEAVRTWLDCIPGNDEPFVMCSNIVQNGEITEKSFSHHFEGTPINSVIIDEGKDVYMKTGSPATAYVDGHPYDLGHSLVESLFSIRKTDTVDEFLNGILQIKFKCSVVDSDRTMGSLTDDERYCISRYYLPWLKHSHTDFVDQMMEYAVLRKNKRTTKPVSLKSFENTVFGDKYLDYSKEDQI